MQENIDQNSWKYKIAEQIVASYGGSEPMSNHIFEKVIIKELLWHATTMRKGENENEGMVQIKYVGQRYWSKKAIEKYIENNKGTGFKNCKGLIHEHAIPRNIIKQLIKTSLNKEADKRKQVKKIHNILNRYSKSVIITKEEDNNIQYKEDFSYKGCQEQFLAENKSKLIEGKEFIDFIIKYRYRRAINEIVDLGAGVTYKKDFKELIKKRNDL